MKALWTFLLILFSAAFLSCNGDKPTMDPTLELSDSSVTSLSSANSIQITILSNTDWNIDNASDWLSITPMSGSGNATITLTIRENSQNKDRVAVTAVKAKHLTQSIKVTQLSSTPQLDDLEQDNW